METVGELKRTADDKLFSGDYAAALDHYCAMVRVQPTNLDARLRVADTLLSMGEVQRAAVIYTSLAQHAANAGYPLRALVALKILSSLEPALGILLRGVADLYARGSKRLGRGARRAPPDLAERLPEDFGVAPAEGDAPQEAEALAGRYRKEDALYPQKLMPIPVLSLLSASEFESVLSAIKLVRAQPGDTIIEEGTAGYSFFVLTRGSVQVYRQGGAGEEALASLHEGAIFGEMALLSAAPRSATVRAVTDCDLLEFDRDALAGASDTVGSMAGALAEFAQERLLSNLMSSAEIFRPLDRRQRMDLIRRFVAVQAEPGAVVIREGDQGRGLYVVLRGEFSVHKDEDGQPTELARLGPGEMFGEISLLAEDQTTATVTASAKSTALFLGREYFMRLIEAVPEIREFLEQLGEDRMMDMRISLAPPGDDVDGDEDIEVEVLI